LKETYDAEVIAFCANIGQEEELQGLNAKAKRTGASKVYIDDLQEEFAKDFIFPMMRAGAIYEGQYFLGTSIARPLIAKRMVEIARKEKAQALAHGATGKGNDQVRFELTAAALSPDVEVIAPWRDERFRQQFPGRQEMIQYCEEKGIPVQASAKKPYSMDRNLLHISYEAGMLEDPWFDAFAPANKKMFTLSVSPEDAPNRAEYVTLEFRKGNCVAVNGRKLSPLGVMKVLNKLGGKHGVGRVDMVENRFVGMKSRGVYESGPLRDRFHIRQHLSYYNEADLVRILERNADKLRVEISRDASVEIAKRSRGTPRVANGRLLWVRDYAMSKSDGRINIQTAKNALEMLGIDHLGLDRQDRKYLQTVLRVFGGGPAGLEAIAHTMGVASDTLEDEVEPFLLRSEMIVRTQRGRVLTTLGTQIGSTSN
ncbi:MAG: argininosuccinate synthase, partial [Pirellula sp.]